MKASALCRVLAMFTAANGFLGCAPNRAEWMGRAAKEQATQATQSIGDPQQVRIEARQASYLLANLAGRIESNPPVKDRQTALAFVADAEEVSSGLQAIADSKTDAEFTNAVLAMCNDTRKAAAPHVGQVMLGIAGGVETKSPPNTTEEQRARVAAYFTTFGQRLIDIPARCEQASSALAEASFQEQQAEAQHQANVTRALTAAAVVFAGTALVAGEVGAAAATRPPVQNNTYYVNQYNNGY